DHRDVERLLARCSVAVAPYAPSTDSFTRYADPGKLKAYLAAGLPIVLTDVPPNARELAAEGVAELVTFDAAAIADAVARASSSRERWLERRAAALAYARRFDWAVLLRDVLEKLGLNPRTNPQQKAIWLATTAGGSSSATTAERKRNPAWSPLTTSAAG